MFSHVTVGSSDIDRSRHFYDALFGVLGVGPSGLDAKRRLRYVHKGASFIVTAPLDGQSATHGNGMTIGFTLDTPEQVDAWQAAGVAAGGRAIEDPPGVREMAGMKLYLAYLRDPDGNKLCGLHRMPAA